ncbi:MAG: glycosyltransferase family 2 protein [Rhodospirillales bacterium]|nr:glycosyltransferase family 2 protein [Rhodospirillales bacterium]
MDEDKNRDIDVVIVSYNRDDDVIRAIGSALDQRNVRQRVIVVDQGSELPVLDRIAAFCRGKDAVTLVELGQNVGVALGRNLGCWVGSAPVIVGLDSDASFARDDALQSILRLLDQRQDVGTLAFRIVQPTTMALDRSTWDFGEQQIARAGEEFEAITFCGTGFAVRRATFEAARGFDGDLFFGSEEGDLARRLLRGGQKILYTPTVEIVHQSAGAARVTWTGGRWYHIVRNTIYVRYKYGESAFRLTITALNYLNQGVRNGLGRQTVKAILAAFAMGMRFKLEGDHELYRLPPQRWDYIRLTNRKPRHGFRHRLRRSFAKLTKQGEGTGRQQAVAPRAGR